MVITVGNSYPPVLPALQDLLQKCLHKRVDSVPWTAQFMVQLLFSPMTVKGQIWYQAYSFQCPTERNECPGPLFSETSQHWSENQFTIFNSVPWCFHEYTLIPA